MPIGAVLSFPHMEVPFLHYVRTKMAGTLDTYQNIQNTRCAECLQKNPTNKQKNLANRIVKKLQVSLTITIIDGV